MLQLVFSPHPTPIGANFFKGMRENLLNLQMQLDQLLAHFGYKIQNFDALGFMPVFWSYFTQ
jgi:hypothetical protein